MSLLNCHRDLKQKKSFNQFNIIKKNLIILIIINTKYINRTYE